MGRINVVVKARSFPSLLRELFQVANCSFQFFAAESRTSPSALGQSILVHEGGPLLVVKDGETLNPSKAEEERGMARFLLERFSMPDDCDAFVFVPALEVVFFEAPGVLIGRFGAEIVTDPVIERGHYLPGDTLAKVLAPSGLDKEDFFKSLTSQELDELRRGPQAGKLIAAVERLAAQAEKADGAAVSSSRL
jgi:hypothetical protein